MQAHERLIGPLAWQLQDLSVRIKQLEETINQLKSLDATIREVQFIIYNYVEKIKEGVVLIQDEKIMWANKSACEMFGYEFDEVVNKSAVEMAHPKYRQQLSARYAMVQAGDEASTTIIWPFISKTREVKYIRPFSYRVMMEGKPAVMSFFYDVTEEKKAQDELALRAEMIDQMMESIFLLDMKGNIQYVNKTACDSLGYKPDEITRFNILDINARDLKEKADVQLKKAIVRKQGAFKTVHMHKDGRRLPVSVRVRVIKRGEQEFILGVVHDVTRDEELL